MASERQIIFANRRTVLVGALATIVCVSFTSCGKKKERPELNVILGSIEFSEFIPTAYRNIKPTGENPWNVGFERHAQLVTKIDGDKIQWHFELYFPAFGNPRYSKEASEVDQAILNILVESLSKSATEGGSSLKIEVLGKDGFSVGQSLISGSKAVVVDPSHPNPFGDTHKAFRFEGTMPLNVQLQDETNSLRLTFLPSASFRQDLADKISNNEILKEAISSQSTK